MRTTSALEAFNSVLNRSLPPHANFFKFIECLKNHEFSKVNDLLNSINEPKTSQRKKRKRDQQRDEKISSNTALLRTKKIKLDEFLYAFSARNCFNEEELTD